MRNEELGMRNKEGRIKTTENAELHGGRIKKREEDLSFNLFSMDFLLADIFYLYSLIRLVFFLFLQNYIYFPII